MPILVHYENFPFLWHGKNILSKRPEMQGGANSAVALALAPLRASLIELLRCVPNKCLVIQLVKLVRKFSKQRIRNINCF